MAIPLVYPIVGGAVLLGGAALRARAVAKKKEQDAAVARPRTPFEPATTPTSPNLPPAARDILSQNVADVAAEAARKAGLPPPEPPVALRPGTRLPTMAELQAQMADPANFARENPQIDFIALPLSTINQAQDALNDTFQRAVVTTNDPPPSGDLIVRSEPSVAAPQVGAIEKNARVIVFNSNASPDGLFAEVEREPTDSMEGIRFQSVRGFVKKQFLKLLPK